MTQEHWYYELGDDKLIINKHESDFSTSFTWTINGWGLNSYQQPMGKQGTANIPNVHQRPTRRYPIP